MSSMRNAVQRRNHRERAQPEERAKWGLLEKHKDYSARAKDFNVKKTKLKSLRKLAGEKNPDEFYFGMMSKGKNAATSAVERRKKRAMPHNDTPGHKAMTQEAVRLAKTQDMGYIRTERNKAMKEVRALEQRVKGIKGNGKKIVFADDEEEQMEKMWSGVNMDENDDDESDEYDDDSEEEEREKRVPRAPLSKEEIQARDFKRMQQREAEKLAHFLDAAQEKLKVLTEAEEQLELQRAKMAKSTTVGGVNKNGVKWKVRERKR
ncbi:hypothetical protein PVAG01_06291 [Phlyctema vagabunda]|uniref:U3 small nucleolar RNA-associated protein 11 n=1 Tax=Phlyctema vagabunda TaxID=108571 RepID=A0ABR4PFU4_9HELO